MKTAFQFLKRLWLRFFPGGRLRLQAIEEEPDFPRKQIAYVVGEQGHQWHIVLACPCNCGENIYLNLLPDSRPLWRLTTHSDGTFTLAPSVWRTAGCRSHFFIRRSRIEWCGQAVG